MVSKTDGKEQLQSTLEFQANIYEWTQKWDERKKNSEHTTAARILAVLKIIMH